MFLAPFRRSEARHFHVGFQGFTQPFLEVEKDRGYKLRMKILSKKKTSLGNEKKGSGDGLALDKNQTVGQRRTECLRS